MIIVGVLVIVYIFMGLIGAAMYLFNSIGLYKLANKNGDKSAYLACIPYLNRVTEGKIAFKNRTLGVTMFILQILSVVVMCIAFFSRNMRVDSLILLFILSFVLSALFKIIDFVAHYKIYSKFSKSAIIMTTLDIVSLGVLGPIFIFAIRDNEPKKEN